MQEPQTIDASFPERKKYTNQCCERKIIEQICKDLPNIGITVSVQKSKKAMTQVETFKPNNIGTTKKNE